MVKIDIWSIASRAYCIRVNKRCLDGFWSRFQKISKRAEKKRNFHFLFRLERCRQRKAFELENVMQQLHITQSLRRSQARLSAKAVSSKQWNISLDQRFVTNEWFSFLLRENVSQKVRAWACTRNAIKPPLTSYFPISLTFPNHFPLFPRLHNLRHYSNRERRR